MRHDLVGAHFIHRHVGRAVRGGEAEFHGVAFRRRNRHDVVTLVVVLYFFRIDGLPVAEGRNRIILNELRRDANTLLSLAVGGHRDADRIGEIGIERQPQFGDGMRRIQFHAERLAIGGQAVGNPCVRFVA